MEVMLKSFQEVIKVQIQTLTLTVQCYSSRASELERSMNSSTRHSADGATQQQTAILQTSTRTVQNVGKAARVNDR